MNSLHEKLNQIKSKMKQCDFSNQSVSCKVLETIVKIAGTAPSGANCQPWTYVLVKDEEIIQSISSESLYIVVLFKQNYGVGKNKEIIKHYYAHESACLSGGMFLAGLHYASIDYKLLPIDPSLNGILKRPKHEKPVLCLSIKGNNTKQGKLEPELDEYYELMRKRRSIRRFQPQSFDKNIIHQMIELVHTLIKDDGYRFVVVDESSKKEKIRNASEQNEKRLYKELISDEWRKALKPLGTNWEKPHLTEAPYLIVVFSKSRSSKTMAGIASGMLIQILHYIGLSTLTYTPSPMKFLNEILDISLEEKPLMVLPVGFKDETFQSLNIKRKKLKEFYIKQW